MVSDPTLDYLTKLLEQRHEYRMALKIISKRNHSDDCPYSAVRGEQCDCHVGVARRALKEGIG
jgi:hypothetical protein